MNLPRRGVVQPSARVMAEDAEVVLIDDEWSRLSLDDHRAALNAWIADCHRSDPVGVSISAAEVLRVIRCDAES